MADREEALQLLLASNRETVTADEIAPVLRMDPGVLRLRVKQGLWDQEAMGKVIQSGKRVKFLRRDFLQKCGFLQPEEPKRTAEDLLAEVIELIRVQNTMLMEISAYIKDRQRCNADG